MSTSQIEYGLQSDKERLNLREELEKYLSNWKWFVLSILLSLSLSFLYFRYATPEYESYLSILIKNKNNNFLNSELYDFEDLGLSGAGDRNLQDEIQILKSRSLILEVVEMLSLNILYFERGLVRETEIYKRSPVNIEIDKKGEGFEEKELVFYLKLLPNKRLKLLDIDKNLISYKLDGDFFLFEGSEFSIHFSEFYEETKDVSKEIRVLIKPLQSAVSQLIGKMEIKRVGGKTSNILELRTKHPVKDKTLDILNTLVAIYNENTILDKNQIGVSTSNFIRRRLEIIREELGILDKKAELYRKENRFTDIEIGAGQFFATLDKNENAVFEISTQLKLAELIEEYITEHSTSFELIPSNLDFSSPAIGALTNEYNQLTLRRNKILRSSSLDNPTIKDLDYQLLSLQKNLKESLKNLKISLKIRLDELSKQGTSIDTKISNVPKKQKEFKEISREQEIKEALYLHLLEKKEENDISVAVTTADSKVIDEAFSEGKSFSIKKEYLFLGSLFFGLFIPFVIIYFKNLLDTKLRTRKDLEENISAPILGDIPINNTGKDILIKNLSRSSGAEAFRLLRTNLDFMFTNVKRNNKCIFITSTIGGEGKTFISINLACALALSGVKIALLGLDLRAPRIIEIIGNRDSKKGISDYIRDTSLKVDDLKAKLEGYENLDIYHSGAIPPNPSEILLNPRIKEMFEYLKKSYDYIIVDTSPVHLVTDTLSISEYADLFIYVLRAGYLDKRFLTIPEFLYKEKRLPNMAMLINAYDYRRSYGYTNYGYYGAYGYGDSKSSLPWWKTILKKKRRT